MCYLPLIYSQEVSAFAALALGLVFTSSCKEEIVMAILQVCNCAVCVVVFVLCVYVVVFVLCVLSAL